MHIKVDIMNQRVMDILDVVEAGADMVWARWRWAIIPLYFLANFYILSATFSENTFHDATDWEWIGFLIAIFLLPILYTDLIQGRKHDRKALKFVIIFRYTTISFTFITGILWYLYPLNARLEPLLFVYGSLAAWTTYLRSRLESLSHPKIDVENTVSTTQPE